MQTAINILLALFKWPIAVLMVLFFIPALKSDFFILNQGLTGPVFLYFFLPLIVMILLWLIFPKFKNSFLAVLEHELTHMLFAILTFHTPQNIHINRDGSGYFSYLGKGNWLIAIAPYFFPTSAAIVILLGIFYPLMGEPFPHFYFVILGFMTGYHLISTLDEIHLKQTDFQSAGYIFSILFLPGINLLIYGFLFSFACFGFKGWPLYIQELSKQILVFFN